MKKITWEGIKFWTVYGTGLATLAVFAVWLVYQALCFAGIVIEFLCRHTNPVFGIGSLCIIVLAVIFSHHMDIRPQEKNTAETRR